MRFPVARLSAALLTCLVGTTVLSSCPRPFSNATVTGADVPDFAPGGNESNPVSCVGESFVEVQTVDIWGRLLEAQAEVIDSKPGTGALEFLAGECAPIAWLGCGQEIQGDNSDPNGGVTWVIDGYPVSVGNYDGGEVAFAFLAPSSAEVSFSLVDPEPTVVNQDLFVLGGQGQTCRASSALARGFNEVSFEAVEGHTYFLLLDSFAGEDGPFRARLDCDGSEGSVELEPETLRAGPLGTTGPISADDLTVTATVTATDYLPTTVTATVANGDFHDVSVTGTARWALSHDERELPGYEGTCQVTTLYVGLDHRWFAASSPRPPREGNKVELMASGEETFEAIYNDLKAATESVHWSTWWWESDLELIKPDWTAPEEDRQEFTILSVLDDLPSVDKKMLISRLCDDSCIGLMDWITIDGDLVDRAETPGDRFEVAMQGNPTSVPSFGEFEPAPVHWTLTERLEARPDLHSRLFEDVDELATGARFTIASASYHQKMNTIDGRISYIMGLNVRGVDWDTSDHEVFEPQRMDFGAPTWRRQEVDDRESLPDELPRRDYAVRVEGPCVADVDTVLAQRWEHSMSSEEPYSEGNTLWTPAEPAAPIAGGVEAQLQVTMPAPLQERSILEGLRKAFAAAEDYILIEDQYWRSPLLNEVLLKTLQDKPEVKLVVITSEVSPLEPAAKWTVETDQLFKHAVPEQYATYTLKSFDWSRGWEDQTSSDDEDPPEVQRHLVSHSLHSKLVIIDDRYLAVGSANKNNRGMLFEGEANLAVLDTAWVSAARTRILRTILGPRFAPQLTDDFDQTWELLQQAAAWNETTAGWWADEAPRMTVVEAQAAEVTTWPSGFLYPLELPTWSVLGPGPDAF